MDGAVASVCPATREDVPFGDWLAELERNARRAGLRPATVDAALRGVRLDQTILERDAFQPEFERPVWDYLASAVSADRIERGRERLARHRALFEQVRGRFGVQPEYIAAIWGIESAYGAAAGNTPVVGALVTLAYGGRRTAWACEELAAAFKILDAGGGRARLVGSWAGATGQTQFMPSKILSFGVDFDHNGQVDLWSELGDVFASTANYLKGHGWKADQPWGIEVALPEGFDYALADPARPRSLAAWADLKVRAVGGRTLADGGLGGNLAGDLEGAIILPGGYKGPAFLVFGNFRTIMKYNYSTSYALAVSLLADRLAGRPGVMGAWPVGERPLKRAERETLQQGLEAAGYPVGVVDGVVGAQTQSAIRGYQKAHGLPADGFANSGLLERLGRSQ